MRKRATSEFIDDPFATFSEWAGEADQRAYADLALDRSPHLVIPDLDEED